MLVLVQFAGYSYDLGNCNFVWVKIVSHYFILAGLLNLSPSFEHWKI